MVSPEILEKEIEFIKKDFGARIENLENQLKSVNQDERTLANSVTKIEGLLEQINASMNRLENSTQENFKLVHSRISSVKNDFESSQKRELESYLAYKKIVIGTVLTAIVGALIGAVLTSYRLFGG